MDVDVHNLWIYVYTYVVCDMTYETIFTFDGKKCWQSRSGKIYFMLRFSFCLVTYWAVSSKPLWTCFWKATFGHAAFQFVFLLLYWHLFFNIKKRLSILKIHINKELSKLKFGVENLFLDDIRRRFYSIKVKCTDKDLLPLWLVLYIYLWYLYHMFVVGKWLGG